VLIFIEIVAALIFVFSSGLLFNGRFRENYWAVGVAGAVALVSSYFLLESLIQRLIVKHTATVTVPADGAAALKRPNDSFFSSIDLITLAVMADTKRCDQQCSENNFSMTRVPVSDLGEKDRFYLIITGNLMFCGSGGCIGAVMLYRRGRMSILHEDQGITDRQAMMVARDFASGSSGQTR
jgi:hypothetical protein